MNFSGNICNLPNVECYLLGVIGNDNYGKDIINKLKNYPINTKFLKIKNGVTANNKVYHTQNGDRYFLPNSWTGGVHNDFCLDEEEMLFLKSADVVHTTIDSPIFKQIIECKKDNSFLLAVDFNNHRDFEKIKLIIEYVDIFFISGSKEIFDKLKKWALKYNTVFVCTLAENGSIAFFNEKEFKCKAIKVKSVVDTTGADDSFQAGFIASYYAEKNIKKSLQFGSKCAAKNILRLGGF